MTTTAYQRAKWADVGNLSGWRSGHGAVRALRAVGFHPEHTVAADNATRDLAAAEELHAPGWLSHDDMRRELGETR